MDMNSDMLYREFYTGKIPAKGPKFCQLIYVKPFCLFRNSLVSVLAPLLGHLDVTPLAK